MYYLNYDEKAKVNYSFLFALYLTAKYNKKDKLTNKIEFGSLKDLCEKIKQSCGYVVSVSTISRLLRNEECKEYFERQSNTITLKTEFRKGKAQSNKFVVLSDEEVKFLISQGNTLLTKFYLYLKYYCGYSANKQIDSTERQILSAIGYCSNSGKNLESISHYNNLLSATGFIKIQKIRDNKGQCRNIYRMNQ